MEITFNGKRALVTGAGKGIGRVIVIELMKCGAQVVALSRTQSDLDSLKAEYPQVEIVLCDLADLQESNKIIAGLGDFDLLVNNAAIAKCGSFLDTKCSDVADMMNINVNAVINVSQVVVKSMIRRGVGGAIVNISSQASMAALADHVGYAATKGALDSATRVMACELGPKNIRGPKEHTSKRCKPNCNNYRHVNGWMVRPSKGSLDERANTIGQIW